MFEWWDCNAFVCFDPIYFSIFCKIYNHLLRISCSIFLFHKLSVHFNAYKWIKRNLWKTTNTHKIETLIYILREREKGIYFENFSHRDVQVETPFLVAWFWRIKFVQIFLDFRRIVLDEISVKSDTRHDATESWPTFFNVFFFYIDAWHFAISNTQTYTQHTHTNTHTHKIRTHLKPHANKKKHYETLANWQQTLTNI